MHDLANDFPLLTLLVAVPVIGALGIAALKRESEDSARLFAVIATVITGLLSLFLVFAFDRHNDGYQFVSQHMWFSAFGIQWKLGVDGISLFLVALSGLVFPLVVLAAKVEEDKRSFFAWTLLIEAGCIGAFLALDLFVFFLFFEAVLVPMYFLIGGWGGARRGYAALKFFLYTFVGSAFMFVALIALAYITSNKSGQPLTFDIEVLTQQAHLLSSTEARWLFVAFAIAFAVKVPLFPVHTWLPTTYEQAPLAGVIISAAVMVKLGTYGLIRFCLELFPDPARDIGPVLLTLAVIGMIYGAIVAAVQHDLRKLLAYSSLSHLGFVVLGTFAFSNEGLSGAVIQMVNHGITSTALFLLLGMIYLRRQSTMIVDLKGIQKVAPVLAGVFTLSVMSSIGVPGLNGFVGEFLILLGTFVTHRWWAVVGTLAVILAAVYLLWAYQRVFHGEPDEANAKISDMNRREGWLMAPLIVLIVFLGVYPNPVLDRVQPSVERVLKDQAVHVTPVAADQDREVEIPESQNQGQGGHE